MYWLGALLTLLAELPSQTLGMFRGKPLRQPTDEIDAILKAAREEMELRASMRVMEKHLYDWFNK